MKLIFLVFLPFLAGCSLFQEKIAVPVAIQHTALKMQDPTPLTLDTVHFIAINKDNAPAVFAQMDKDGKSQSLLGLDQQDYESYELNLEKIQGRLLEDRTRETQILKYYDTPITLGDKQQ